MSEQVHEWWCIRREGTREYWHEVLFADAQTADSASASILRDDTSVICIDRRKEKPENAS